ncbi:ThuA domain-containing protein, partial [Klebsiella variicola]|uniref:ThuA domain-containing protein n=1 Tax=Klebsiella variicola TaxID=244366 RepID=UPI0013B37FA0
MTRLITVISMSLLLLGSEISLADKPLKVLLLGKEVDHPYGTHMYLFECELLAKCLRQSPEIEAIVSNGWPRDPKVLEDVDVIVSYSADAGSELLSGRQKADFERMMASGVGFVALHWSTGAQKKEVGPRWQEILGAWFSLDFSRLNVTQSLARKATPSHPISRGWDDFP